MISSKIKSRSLFFIFHSESLPTQVHPVQMFTYLCKRQKTDKVLTIRDVKIRLHSNNNSNTKHQKTRGCEKFATSRRGGRNTVWEIGAKQEEGRNQGDRCARNRAANRKSVFSGRQFPLQVSSPASLRFFDLPFIGQSSVRLAPLPKKKKKTVRT